MTHKELFEKYDELVNKWEFEMGPISSVSQMTNNDAYRELKLLGPEIVPFIIADFYYGDYHHLFELVRELSGEDIEIPEPYWGNIPSMSNIFVWWGIHEKDILSLDREALLAYNIETEAGKALLEDAMNFRYEFKTELGKHLAERLLRKETVYNMTGDEI